MKNIVKVQILDVVVTMFELEEDQRLALKPELIKFIETRDPELGKKCLLDLFRASLVSFEGYLPDGSYGRKMLTGDAASDAFLEALLSFDSPFTPKLVEVMYQVANGKRTGFIDQHGLPIVGVKVISSLASHLN